MISEPKREGHVNCWPRSDGCEVCYPKPVQKVYTEADIREKDSQIEALQSSLKLARASRDAWVSEESRQRAAKNKLVEEVARLLQRIAYGANQTADQLAGAKAANAVLKADNDRLLNEKNAEHAAAQYWFRRASDALAELKQYKARCECASAALQGKEGQYQLQEVAPPKPKPVSPPFRIDWASPQAYGVPGGDLLNRGVRA